MTDISNAALRLSRVLLRILVVLNLFTGVLMVIGFGATFVFANVMADYFQQRELNAAILFPVFRVWLVLALPMVAAVHVQLTKLLEIVRTVDLGDPFVPENAARLKTIAWALLVVQVLHLVFGVMVRIAAEANADMSWSFSITGWLAVLLLFVLARVFAEGARIRGDLEAMI